jgi:hypothetical protein
MLNSVRVRLTLWYSAVLAVVLLVLGGAMYLLLARNAMQSTDSNLSELADAFLTTVDAELESDTSLPGLVEAAREAIAEHRFRDDAFVVLDPDGKIVITSEDWPVAGGARREFPHEVFASESFQKLARSTGHGARTFAHVAGGRDGYRGGFAIVAPAAEGAGRNPADVCGRHTFRRDPRYGRGIFPGQEEPGARCGYEYAGGEDQRLEFARAAEDSQ